MKTLSPWLKCTRCRLHARRRNVVLGRGFIPADILFVGEAPGKSEDLRGKAFIGPAGRLFNKALLHINKTFFITNTLGCRPTDKKFGANREPEDDEMIACWPRLEATEKLVKPKVIILLGKIAERFCKKRFPGAYCLRHPAYILRRGGTGSAEFRQFVRQLKDIEKDMDSKTSLNKRMCKGSKSLGYDT